MSLLIFIVILVVLVWVHELGHLVAAKLFGIRVDEFNIGFGPSWVSAKWGETRYSFKPILLGGYVSINEAHMAQKNRLVQAAVIVAGVLSNVLFAWLILAGGYMHGLQSAVVHDGWGTVQHAQATIVGVLPGSPADKAGVQNGDTIVSVQTGSTQLPQGVDASEVHDFLTSHANESVALRLVRAGVEKDFIVKAADGVVPGRKALGVELDDVGTLVLPPQQAVLQAGVVTKNIFQAEASGLGGLVGGLAHGQGALNQVSGPIGIVSAGSQFVAQGFDSTVTIIAIISLNLALINLVPIPGLDGGRLLFIAIEAIIRRPLSARVATALTIAGFAFIILLLVVISAHDIVKLVG